MGTQSYGNVKTLSLYYGTKEKPEADFPFNFQMINLTQDTLSGIEVHRLVDDWLSNIPVGVWPNWVVGFNLLRHGNRIRQQLFAASPTNRPPPTVITTLVKVKLKL